MNNTNKSIYRAETSKVLLDYLTEKGEDCGMITSNCFNLPIVVNGEEGWAEITIKVTNDEDDDGYMKREQYKSNCILKAEQKADREKKKAEKIAKQQQARELKKKSYQERG